MRRYTCYANMILRERFGYHGIRAYSNVIPEGDFSQNFCTDADITEITDDRGLCWRPNAFVANTVFAVKAAVLSDSCVFMDNDAAIMINVKTFFKRIVVNINAKTGSFDIFAAAKIGIADPVADVIVVFTDSQDFLVMPD